MLKDRFLAYTDAILAIIVTIIVLEFRVPHMPTRHSLYEQTSLFVSYILSFIVVTIYWINHHYVFQQIQKISTKVIWLNAFMTFCISLLPFATSWIAETHFSSIPVVFYGMILNITGIFYLLLVRTVLCSNGHMMSREVTIKGYTSVIITLSATFLGLRFPMTALSVFFVVNLLRFIPNKALNEYTK